jgi:hypothetical protein
VLTAFSSPCICEALFEQKTFNGSLPFPQAFACDSAWLLSFFFFFPANASSVTTAAADATSITATAATIAKVMYDFILSLKTRIKTISAAMVEATNIILEILSIVNSNLI